MVERVREHEFLWNVALADLQIMAALSNTIEDHPQAFLLEENSNNDQTIITFASPPCLQLLSNWLQGSMSWLTTSMYITSVEFGELNRANNVSRWYSRGRQLFHQPHGTWMLWLLRMDTGQTMNPGMSRLLKPYRAFPPARMTDRYILCFAMRSVLAPKTSLVQN